MALIQNIRPRRKSPQSLAYKTSDTQSDTLNLAKSHTSTHDFCNSLKILSFFSNQNVPTSSKETSMPSSMAILKGQVEQNLLHHEITILVSSHAHTNIKMHLQRIWYKSLGCLPTKNVLRKL